MSRDQPAPVPHFCAALRNHPAALAALPYTTRQRRVDGWLPPIFDWLLDYPELLEALAADAYARQTAATRDEAA